MVTKKTILEKNSMLVREFDKYILEHPEFADCIPDDALVVIQLEGDEEFNAWAREAAQIAGEGHHIAFVKVTDIKPVRSEDRKIGSHPGCLIPISGEIGSCPQNICHNSLSYQGDH